MDTRSQPAARSASIFGPSRVPGFASTVNSRSRERSHRDRRISPRRASSSAESTVGVPPPTKIVSGAKPAGARAASSRSRPSR